MRGAVGVDHLLDITLDLDVVSIALEVHRRARELLAQGRGRRRGPAHGQRAGSNSPSVSTATRPTDASVGAGRVQSAPQQGEHLVAVELADRHPDRLEFGAQPIDVALASRERPAGARPARAGAGRAPGRRRRRPANSGPCRSGGRRQRAPRRSCAVRRRPARRRAGAATPPSRRAGASATAPSRRGRRGASAGAGPAMASTSPRVSARTSSRRTGRASA